ncbi:16S rRNA (cytosine(1402)-N(4))-methyltransferase RsmH [Helicobacter kayseriensis]|uniref:16S rRNA (cytosine(1402)-N(4))-methyltransferase RsmH n=1 Tax=Helicobacter kayseriensis TaxID=2905877 RepID=UPI001E36FE2D|nr:16S rRNA (cytosine(1402)-N(4))-methyltransferase RsmH [Helicobacter kayseriensis]MCE3047595.1 16S rRNA (cytosine(1402)-N(4))-methyltransferase RsmH [Helicobacter kayseriensis]MCE3048966.1 16S rRNA (cytosine(1402)-N(4))-methyltransferase RsmH [Helicobacter kayseriensis]
MNPHIPVLKEEVLELFSSIPENGILIDCTLGFGGHTSALLQAHPTLQIIGIDQDRDAQEYCKQHIRSERLRILEGNFSDKIDEALQSSPIVGILADIGVSSFQLDTLERGFSFDSPVLDMRMNQECPISAEQVINTYSKLELEKIFRDYGEIREYKKMAALILQERQKQPFRSAAQLSAFLQKHFKRHHIHPATLAFQALRIEVNQELNVLQTLLQKICNASSKLQNTILSIISFHSLEDRIIKNTFKDWEKSCICPQSVMRCECGNHHSHGKILTKKPISATQAELSSNIRSRSAKLRAFQFGRQK